MDNRYGPSSHIINLLDYMPQMAWYKDAQGRFITVNQAFADACGKSKKDIIGKTDFELWPYELALQYVEDDRDVMETRSHKLVDERIADRSGNVWFQTFKTPVFDENGLVIGTIGTAGEISKQKAYEVEVENQKRFMKSIIDATPDFIFYKDIHSIYLGCNNAFAQQFIGRSEEEIIGKTDSDFIYDPDLANYFKHRDQEVFNHKSTLIYEESLILTDGSLMDVETANTPFFDENGEVAGLIGISRDITDRKVSLNRLKAQNAYLEMLLRTVPSAVYTMDNNRIITSWNKIAEKITGFSEKEVLGKDACSFSFHPCRENCGLFGHEIVLPKASLTCRIRHKSGEIRYVLKNVDALRDDSGEIIGRIECFVDITERVIMDKLLKESEMRLNLANASAKVGLWDWNIQTGDTIFNEQWAEMVGYTLDELEPTTIKTWLTLAHPEDLDVSSQALEDHFTGKTDVYEIEARMRHKDGHWIWVINRGKVIEWDSAKKPVRMVGTHFDITERKKTEEELLKKEKLLTAVAMSIRELIENRDYLEAIQKCFSMIGNALSIDAAYLNINLFDMMENGYTKPVVVWHSESAKHQDRTEPAGWAFSEVESFLTSLTCNDSVCGLAGECPDEGTRKIMHDLGMRSVAVTPVYVRGALWGFITYGDRISERVWIESEITSLRAFASSIEKTIERSMIEKELEAARVSAEAANTMKSQFLANISHEIRTPIHAIMGYASLMHDITTQEEGIVYLNAIKKAGNTLLELITDILDLSRIEAGRLELQIVPVDIRHLFEDILDTFNYKAQEKKIELHIAVEPNIPKIILIDEVKIRQILFNLVGNAVKFTETGKVEVSLKAKSFDYRNKKLDLRFEVSDTGIGIPEDQHQSIFEPFKQKDGQSNKKYGGTGLGLTISKRLIEMMGGAILLKSVVDEGTTFMVDIPGVMIGKSHLRTDSEAVMYNDVVTAQRQAEDKVSEKTASYVSQELVNKLELLRLEVWEGCARSNRIQDMRKFSTSLWNIGTIYKHEDLLHYAESLQACINTYNLKKVKELLMRFPNMLEKLRKKSRQGGVNP